MVFPAEYGVRHRQHDEQETKRNGGQQESLNIAQRRRCKKRRQPALERSHPTEERRLETRTPVRSLGDREQQLSVCGRVAERRYHPIVAVHLDRQT